MSDAGQTIRKPRWLKKPIPSGGVYRNVARLMDRSHLHTVCREARCPNMGECFSRGTATFLILGDVCTRSCRFCAIAGGRPEMPDPDEPRRIANAVEELGLSYAVVTSVTRDDLPDGGAGHYVRTIQSIREMRPKAGVEVLIPDFMGDADDLNTVLDAGPSVLNHNVETVPRLYDEARPEASYERSLDVFRNAANYAPRIPLKSGIMLGLGEREDEVGRVLTDLRAVGCHGLTIGQYLQPSPTHLSVKKFVSPDKFEEYRNMALDMGFTAVFSGPFVRSSYRAEEMMLRISE